uniref:Ubiquitin carboxyl-terminal hydrolase n=1 Tax=Octopus bimaculoides TaxID=37653 RepID=A0A0L8HLR6_OCTBM
MKQWLTRSTFHGLSFLKKNMNKGWLELESDPGLFTLLLEDFGVQGVQVEEIYDLQKQIEGPVYGFIFLFRWIEERRCRRKTNTEEEFFLIDEKAVNSIFFAKQVIPNSCATHALLSILLNNDKVRHGKTLSKLKEFTKNMNPEDKGHAIGNMPELARAHNSHARPEPRHLPEKQQGISTVRTMEAFHFVSYVPINGHLFELDGLKPYPIDHGPWQENEDWTEKFRRVISERLGTGTGGEPYHDIWFNLMAVVPDRRQLYENKLMTLKKNRQIILDTLQQMVKVMSPVHQSSDKGNANTDSKSAAQQNPNPASKLNSQTQPNETKATPEDTSNATTSVSSTSATSTAPLVTTITARLPAALDSHNYAKSPILEEVKPMEDKETENNLTDPNPQPPSATLQPPQTLPPHSTKADVTRLSAENLQRHQLHTVKESNVKIHIAVTDDREGEVTLPKTVSSTDVTKPLKIETRFGGSSGPGSESTDTASDSGSVINSPNIVPVVSTLNSSLTSEGDTAATPSRPADPHQEKAVKDPAGSVKEEKMECDSQPSKESSSARPVKEESASRPNPVNPSSHPRSSTKQHTRQAFTPKDLYDLMKNVEKEITTCENNLKDEVDKRNKYKFICTFLSFLAQEGHLAELVEQHMLTSKRQGVSVGRLSKLPSSGPDRRKRARTKRRR